MSTESFKYFELDLDGDFFIEFQIHEGPVLGRGSSGEVVLATFIKHPQYRRAVKKFPLTGADAQGDDAEEDARVRRNFQREVQMMKQLHHPNIMPLVAYVKTPRYLALIMPYCPKGTLAKMLTTLVPALQARYMRQVTEAVEYLHNRNIIHGDIKPQNVLISDDDTALLSDFGLSRAVPHRMVEMFVHFGTTTYRAPETFSDDRVNPFKTDLYSLGVTLWAIALKRKPKLDIPFVRELELATHVPLKYRSVIESLLHINPAERPTATHVLEDM
ncbi:aurora kinase A-like [Physella acuta]|uniref:aurora kinase A-like n=1 Tax=Physella acuta TaxID=109671 RepID=UPI0027DDEE76|nr:aurora kinase A-like [Physella acuta]